MGMVAIHGSDFAMGRTAHNPGKRQTYGIGRSSHDPRGRGWRNMYGVRGAVGDWWSANLGEILDFGRDWIFGNDSRPQLPSVPPPAPPPPPAKETDWTPIAVGGGVLFLAVVLYAMSARRSGR